MDEQQPFILLVEDNPDDEALTLRAFRKTNFGNQIVVVHDGAEALDFLFARGAYTGRDKMHRPQIILLDLKLPKIDGLQVLEQIRASEHIRAQPVIILTSSREQEDLLQSYLLGANSYVRKPVDFNQFIDAVQQLGLYWLGLLELPW